MVSELEVRKRLEQAFPSADKLELTDLTGTQDHYRAVIVSPSFLGKSRVEQHQMVYAALGEWMGGAVHALALETYEPEAWKKKHGMNEQGKAS